MPVDWTKIEQHKWTCARCTAEGLAEPKEGCMGGCPNCGKFLEHGEPHAADCTWEEDYKLLTSTE